MASWRKNSEEASVVFIGHFNPKIFHPEWLIGKGIYKRWDYESDQNLMSLPDIARCNLPDNQQLEVLLNRFVMKAQRQSDFVVFRDRVVEIFTYLAETPVKQMGMNYIRLVSTSDRKVWYDIGTKFANRDPWESIVPYYKNLESQKQPELGLYGLTYHLPRPDENSGYLRVKLEISGPLKAQTLQISVNNHIAIEEATNTAQIATNILSESWESALQIAEEIIDNILK